MKIARVWFYWISAPVLITLIHEVGHLVIAAVVGARPVGIHVGPFGGGFAEYNAVGLGLASTLFVLGGGLLFNFASGFPLLRMSGKAAPGNAWGTAAAVYGGLSVVLPAGYLFLGFSRGVGDPAMMAEGIFPHFFASNPTHLGLRMLLVAASAGGVLWATWATARAFVRHQQALWPHSTRFQRIARAAVLAAPVVVLFGLRVGVSDPSGVARDAILGRRMATLTVLADLNAAQPTDPARFREALAVLRQRHEPDTHWPFAVLALIGGMVLVGALATGWEPDVL